VGFEFIIPTEEFGGALEAQDGMTGGNPDDSMTHVCAVGCGWRLVADLFLERKLMQHVGQRFRVHQAMLNGDVEELSGGG
jgi:hypothetical protein